MSKAHRLGADAIRLAPEDNVATVLRDVKAGERIEVQHGTARATLHAAQAIPLCHKISLTALEAGDRILKYGHPIGEASTAIPAGAHVHVHNLRSLRGRQAG